MPNSKRASRTATTNAEPAPFRHINVWSTTRHHPTVARNEHIDRPEGTCRILVAEDDPAVRNTTRRFLMNLGYEVEAYASGSEVLSALAQDERIVDLLLTDFDMPGLTGYELGQRLRALRPEVKILLTSGLPEEKIMPAAKPADWPPFIPKPYSFGNLKQRLREVLQAPSGRF
jgi:CheY-like chemotaxis protein